METLEFREDLLSDLRSMFEHLAPLLLPDFIISGSMPAGHCTRVEYTVTMLPGTLTSKTAEPIKVAVECKGDRGEYIGTHIWAFPPEGGERKGVFEWPIPSYSGPWDPDWDATATLTVNPAGPFHIAELKESNNTITVMGTCVG